MFDSYCVLRFNILSSCVPSFFFAGEGSFFPFPFLSLFCSFFSLLSFLFHLCVFCLFYYFGSSIFFFFFSFFCYGFRGSGMRTHCLETCLSMCTCSLSLSSSCSSLPTALWRMSMFEGLVYCLLFFKGKSLQLLPTPFK